MNKFDFLNKLDVILETVFNNDKGHYSQLKVKIDNIKSTLNSYVTEEETNDLINKLNNSVDEIISFYNKTEETNETKESFTDEEIDELLNTLDIPDENIAFPEN